MPIISFHLTIGTLEAVSSAKPRLVLALARQPNSIKPLIKRNRGLAIS